MIGGDDGAVTRSSTPVPRKQHNAKRREQASKDANVFSKLGTGGEAGVDETGTSGYGHGKERGEKGWEGGRCMSIETGACG